MFGSKLKTWMETRIGRQKKKPGRERGKDKLEKTILESSESLAHSDTGISSGSLQISTTDCQDGYGTTTMESDKRGVTSSRTVNLSSPESAYSTGYSTDGASPGDATHPEYYINIRTGKHYFPSPAPTPTSPNPHPYPRTCITTSFLSSEPRIPPLQTFPTWLADPETFDDRRPVSHRDSAYCDIYNTPKKAPPKSPLNSLKFFLKSPKQDKVKPKPDFILESKVKGASKGKKWYKQPFRFSHKSSDSDVKSDERKEEVLKYSLPEQPRLPDKVPLQLPGEVASSPRQRNRIRTNPWIPTEPMSSQSFRRLQLAFSPSLLRNRSCTNTPLQQRKTPDDPPILDRLQQVAMQCEASKGYLATLEKAVGQQIDQKLFLEISDHSEEDLTLNEMMGTYNESYVYEKETDILSDSDPTDCEDYVSDSEANHGGDEDSHDDELDYIDTGSLVETDENTLNTGRVSYHDGQSRKTSFLGKNRHQSSLDAENRRNSRKEKEAKKRRRDEKKRRSMKKIEAETEIRKVDQPTGEVSLRKVLLQRMIDKNCSKSAESSPVGLRRRSNELKETHIGSPKPRDKYDISFFADFEADKKYNELIQEAENMLESMKNTPVMERRAEITSPYKRSPLRTANLARSPKMDARRETPRRSPKNLGLKLSVGGGSRKGMNDSERKVAFRAKSSAHSPLDPLGPTFRNFSVFKEHSSPKKISSSSSDDSEGNQPRPAPPTVMPFGFQFVDLGQSTSSHCPQSEPVKRKMYTCSKTYDRLVRTFDSPSGQCARPIPPAFYNPMYSPCPRPRPLPLLTSHLGRRSSDVTAVQS